ncbi:MAG: hypothetical protein ACR2JR_09625 [Rubrobacteraceae bacterium]
MSSERNGAAGEGSRRQGIQPRYRRGFGCATWVNMGMLAFLAAAFVLPLPLWWVGDGVLFGEIQFRLSLFGIVLLLPGMALGAAVGSRTYRAPVRAASRVGAGIGALASWTSFVLIVAWLSGGIVYLYAPFALAAAGLVLYALYARGQSFGRRRTLVLLATAISVVSGIVALALDPSVLGPVGALFSVAAGAIGGWVAGFGYARAGGDEMIPPGSTIRPKGPRQPRRKPR